MARASYVTSARAMALGAPPLAWLCAAQWPDFTPPLTTPTNPTDTLIAMNAAGAGGVEMQVVLKNFMATDFTASDYLA